ncbi:MAG: HYR domain-containing protein [Chitinophagales bacterium]|nr:HYR domain-containing protein [Chitinophagales bacterium]
MSMLIKQLLFLLCIIAATTIVHAQTWNGSVSNDWAEPGNWNGGAVPIASGNVTIPNVWRKPVIKDGTDAFAKSVYINKNSRLTVENGASLTINNAPNNGIENNEGTVNNHGSIHIGMSGNFAIWNYFRSAFNNYGTIEIGVTMNARRGIFNANNFTNWESGNIKIDRLILGEGFKNQGTITNKGNIEIGFNKKVQAEGIVNTGTFRNEQGALIQIEETGGSGLNDVENFFNDGKIIIGANKKPAGVGIELRVSNFNNNACGEIYVYDNVSLAVGSTIKNNGLFLIDTDLNHSVSQSSIINNGILAYPQGNFLPATTNNDIIIAPKSGECTPITPSFTLGGSVSFNILGIFSDQAGTTSAGSYTQNNNTFTDNPTLTDGTAHQLYVQIEDPTGGCTRLVPWNLTVDDTTPPSFTCPSNLTVNMETGNCHGLVPDFAASINATDNCGNVLISQNVPANSSFGAADGDQISVTITADDGNGNQNATPCEVTLTLNDNEAPSFTCPANQTINMDLNTCSGTVPNFSTLIPSVTDNCGAASITQSEAAYSSFGAAHNDQINVTITANDGNGNQNAIPCIVTLTLNDNQAPTFSCPSDMIVAISPISCEGIVPNLIDGISDEFDNCGTPNLSQDVPAGTTFGPMDGFQQSVTITADDGNGNTTTCNLIVSTEENQAPNAMCQNVTIQLDANGNASTTAQAADNGSSDNCGIQNMTLSQTDFGCQDVGANAVTLTVTDFNNNSAECLLTVFVEDVSAPLAECVNVTVQLDENGIGSTTADAVNNNSSDVCGIGNISLSQTDFNCNDVGANSETLTVTDINGNSSTCTSIITVVDNVAPLANCQNISTLLDASGNATITEDAINNNSTDACGGLNYDTDITHFDCSHIGTNTVTLNLTDANGNSSICTAIVTVQDNGAPTASCQNITTQLDASGNASIAEDAINNNSIDACGGLSYDTDITNFDCSHLGMNTVALTVTDANGNSNTCTAIVTVEDQMMPNTICLNKTIEIEPDGTYELIEADVFDAASSYDNCGIVQVDFPATTYTCDEAGFSFTIPVTATDAANNSSSCNAYIQVEVGSSLSSTWSTTDIGQSGLGNDYSFDPCSSTTSPENGAYTLTGGGNNAISSTTDNIAFASQTLCGNGSITAKIESVGTNGYGGLMIRETADAGAKQVSIFSNLSNILRHEARYTVNGLKQVNSFFKPTPYWLKLERQGDWIFAYYSSTGSNFQYVHGVYVPMQQCVEIGLASFTFLPTGQTTAIFSNVSTTGNVSSAGGTPTALAVDTPKPQYHNTQKSNKLSLFPNPVTAHFTLQLEVPLQQSTTVTVVNLYGQAIAEQRLAEGQIRQEWDSTDWPAGTYVLKVQRNGQLPIIKQFVVME